MTKTEKARKVAEHMHKVNNNVDVERMTEVLFENMSDHEIEVLFKNIIEHEYDCALKNHERGGEIK